MNEINSATTLSALRYRLSLPTSPH